MNPLSKLSIDQEAVLHNLDLVRKHISTDTLICACVKANAYGHGLVRMSQLLIESRVDWLAVVNADEVRTLRNTGIQHPILVLGYIAPTDIPEMIELQAQMYVWTKEQVECISVEAQQRNIEVRVHIPVETGMGRLGIPVDDIEDFIRYCKDLPNIVVEGLAQHYATGDEIDSEYFQHQQQIFQVCLDQLDQANLLPRYIHSDNSGAALIQSTISQTNVVRVGAALYGFAPSSEVQEVLQKDHQSLQPVLSWKTELISIKTLKAGTSISYGATETLKQDILVGVLPVGYSDGYDRGLSGQSEVLIRGTRCRVLGRVCMNMMMVDLSGVPDVSLGEEVVLVGRQGSEQVTLEELADIIGTIPYEVCTRIRG